MNYNYKRYLWNLDHRLSDLAKEGNTVNKEQLAKFLDAEVVSEAQNFRVDQDGLHIALQSLTINKPGYLIKTNLNTAEDSLTFTSGVISEVNFGWLIDKSFKYKPNETYETWSNFLQVEVTNEGRSKDVYYNKGKWEWRTALGYYSLEDTYKAMSNSKPCEIWQASHASLHNDLQENPPYFITTSSSDGVNRLHWDDVSNNKDINLIKLIESDQFLSWEQQPGSCILCAKRYPTPAGGKILRISHVPAADLKIPDIVQRARLGEYKNYSLDEMVALGSNIPLGALAYDGRLSPWFFEVDSAAFAAHASTQLVTVSYYDEQSLFGTGRDDDILHWDVWVEQVSGGSAACSRSDPEIISAWLKEHETDLCCNRAEIDLLSLEIQSDNNFCTQIDIASSVFPLQYPVHEYQLLGSQKDNDAVLNIAPFDAVIISHWDGKVKNISHEITWQWVIQLKNWIFDTKPQFTSDSLPFTYDGRVFKPQDKGDYGYADYSYAVLENCVWWDQCLLAPNTSLFINNKDQLTSTTTKGETINTYLNYGCWDLMNHSISKLSCEVAAKLKISKPTGALNIQYTNEGKYWSDAPLMYYKNSAEAIRCLYLPETTPSIDSFTFYVTLERNYALSTGEFQLRDFFNGNVAAVAAFVRPDIKKLGFNTKTTYGYFWISDRVKITAIPTSFGASWFIENYTLQTYSYAVSNLRQEELPPLSYAQQVSRDPLIFNNTTLTPNSEGKTIWIFSEETGWTCYQEDIIS